jgi:hypothetical protein
MFDVCLRKSKTCFAPSVVSREIQNGISNGTMNFVRGI